MGQKVNPHGLRVGVIKDWDSKWYAEGDFADCLVEDYQIRKFLKKNRSLDILLCELLLPLQGTFLLQNILLRSLLLDQLRYLR